MAYPHNFIVLIGDEVEIGAELGTFLLREAFKARICILKGGIDAVVVEFP